MDHSAGAGSEGEGASQDVLHADIGAPHDVAMVPRFTNRIEAGRMLARKLQRYAQRKDTLVLALPRGGVPVAYEIAVALHLPLDVLIVRKIGVPLHPELAMGALAGSGAYTINREVVEAMGISNEEFATELQREQHEVNRREEAYRAGRKPPDVTGKTVIIVDDGLATGSTMRAAIEALRTRNPAAIVLAVPVAPMGVEREFGGITDDVVCVYTPEPFYAVGAHYIAFGQVGDTEVRELLAKAAREVAA